MLALGLILAMLPFCVNGAWAEAALNKTKATMINGTQLKLKLTGTKRTAQWSSSNAKVAKVSQKGVVKALKVGKAKITAKVGQKKLTCDVTVKSALSASATKLKMDAGSTKKVKLVCKNGVPVLQKYDSSVLKCTLSTVVDGKCTLTVKAIRGGVQTLTVKNTRTNDVLKIKVTVREAEPADGIVDKTRVTLAVGKSATVKVTWPYSGLPYVNWGPNVECSWGEWNGSGWPMIITGVKKGECLVTITKGDGGETVARIEVTVV